MPKKRKLGTKKTVIEVEYHKLEELVKEVYGDQKYNFVAVQECGNDSTHSFAVDGKIFDEDEAKEISGGHVPMYSNGRLLNVLCADGYIEKGTYNVDVCW